MDEYKISVIENFRYLRYNFQEENNSDENIIKKAFEVLYNCCCRLGKKENFIRLKYNPPYSMD